MNTAGPAASRFYIRLLTSFIYECPIWLFRSTDDPQELVLLLEWEDLKKAVQFRQSNELRERQQRAGVVGKPAYYDEVGHFSA